MRRKPSLALVIDASVLRSAGETQHPVSMACRDTLVAILEICHRTVSTTSLSEEGKRHASRFSRKWLRSMAARKKLVRGLTTTAIAIDTEDLTPNQAEAIEKDRHLIEAALAADRVIVTRDSSIKDILAKTRKGKRFLTQLRWINPEDDGCDGLARL
jgi:predicted nuclease of predicted toxin-antitoxin system